MSTHIKGGSQQVPNFGIFQVWHLAKLDLPFSTPTPLKINKGEFAPSLPSRSVAVACPPKLWDFMQVADAKYIQPLKPLDLSKL